MRPVLSCHILLSCCPVILISCCPVILISCHIFSPACHDILTTPAHVYNEEVLPLIHFAHTRFVNSPIEMAINSTHSLAFHRGLGNSTASASQTPYTKYHGGEERLAHDGGNAMVIAFPGSSSFTGQFYKPELAVLGSLLGGKSAVKWSPGFTVLGQAKATPTTQVNTTSAIYSDAGLLFTSITGSAQAVADTAKAAVDAIKKIAAGEISSEQISKAKAAAKFKELENGQDIRAGLQLSGNGLVNNSKAYQIDEVAQAIDGVSEEAVKSVSLAISICIYIVLTRHFRLPRHYSRTGLPSLRSVTSSFCRTLRSWALRCKYSHAEERVRCKISFGSGLV